MHVYLKMFLLILPAVCFEYFMEDVLMTGGAALLKLNGLQEALGFFLFEVTSFGLQNTRTYGFEVLRVRREGVSFKFAVFFL